MVIHDRSYRVYTVQGISPKLKYEPGVNNKQDKQTQFQPYRNNNKNNPYTEMYIQNKMKNDKNLTRQQILNELICNKCNKKAHVMKDCRSKVSQDNNEKKTTVNVIHTDKLNETDEETPAHLKGFFMYTTSNQEQDEMNFNCVNIDDHANVHLFCNKSLLTNIRKLDNPIKVNGMGGLHKNIEYMGTHPLLGDVLYDPQKWI